MGFLHWLSECDTPPSIHSHQLPESDALSIQNDSNPDPTYQDCWPSERYKSDGPDDGDQCDECRSAPGRPHATGCENTTQLTDGVSFARETPKNLRVGAPNEHPTADFYTAAALAGVDVGPECDVSQTGNFPATGNIAHVESCPECGVVTDICDEVRYPDEWADELTEAGNPLHAHMRETFDACLAISVAKNADYASSSDPLANFRACQQFGVPLTKGIMVRLSDKFARIGNLLENEAQVKNEAIADTIRDACNYLAILAYALEAEA